MKENFIDITGYVGLYQISNFGNVKSVDRIYIDILGRTVPKKGRILKPTADNGGYLTVKLSNQNGNGKTFRIHVLVTNTFIPNPDKLPEVDHIDSDKKNNCVDNLQWIDRKGNARKRICSKLTIEKANEIRKLFSTENYTFKMIADIYEVAPTTISNIVYNKIWV